MYPCQGIVEARFGLTSVVCEGGSDASDVSARILTHGCARVGCSARGAPAWACDCCTTRRAEVLHLVGERPQPERDVGDRLPRRLAPARRADEFRRVTEQVVRVAPASLWRRILEQIFGAVPHRRDGAKRCVPTQDRIRLRLSAIRLAALGGRTDDSSICAGALAAAERVVAFRRPST
jgi:hypothetical protein